MAKSTETAGTTPAAETPKTADPNINVTTGDHSEVLKVGEHEFRSVDELKEAYLSLDRAIGKQGQEVGELRKMLRASAKPSESEDDPKFYEKFEAVLYSDPKEAAKMIDARLEAKARRLVDAEREKIMQASAAERAEDALWDEFFGKFPKWSANRTFVRDVTRAVLMPKLDSIENKEDQFREIDSYFTQHLGDIGDAAGSRPLVSRKPAYESGGAPSGASGKRTSEPEKPKTLVDQLQESGYSKTA